MTARDQELSLLVSREIVALKSKHAGVPHNILGPVLLTHGIHVAKLADLSLEFVIELIRETWNEWPRGVN